MSWVRVLVAGAAALVLLGAVAAGAALASGRAARSPILYWSDAPIPSIWSVRTDGTHRRRILLTTQNAKRPRMSPDGRLVAFDGTRPGVAPMSDFDIQVVRPDGSGRRTLTSTPAWDVDAQWSPVGRRLAFSRMPSGSRWLESWIWTIRPDGRDARRLAKGYSARWSPDGRQLVFDAPTRGSEADLFVVNADGSGLHRLTATPEIEQPAGWSPDGTAILLTRYALAAAGGDVYVMALDGGTVRRLTRSPGDDVAASWSPDDSRILFTSARAGGTHLFVMRADGSRQRRVTQNAENEYEPSWR